nr:hypothetical protein [Achromobacter ruhlandii]
MLSFDGLVEICQDGAGVIEVGSDKAKGFFTTGVENCIVTIYECEDAAIMIHDSGQNQIVDITKLVKSYGAVKQLTIVKGMLAHELHEPRLKNIIRAIGLNAKKVVRHPVVDLKKFTVVYQIGGYLEAADIGVPAEAPRIPDLAKREAIVRANNFFLPPNSQSLALTIEYRDGQYSDVPKLGRSLGQMLKAVKEQPEYFFLNLSVLYGAHEQGLIEMPAYLREIVIQRELQEAIFHDLSEYENAAQYGEHRKYLRHLAES